MLRNLMPPGWRNDKQGNRTAARNLGTQKTRQPPLRASLVTLTSLGRCLCSLLSPASSGDVTAFRPCSIEVCPLSESDVRRERIRLLVTTRPPLPQRRPSVVPVRSSPSVVAAPPVDSEQDTAGKRGGSTGHSGSNVRSTTRRTVFPPCTDTLGESLEPFQPRLLLDKLRRALGQTLECHFLKTLRVPVTLDADPPRVHRGSATECGRWPV